MKRIFTLLLLTATLLSGCAVFSPPADDDPILLEFEAQTWQLHCAGGKNSVDAQAAQHFAQLIHRATNGAVTVECVFSSDPENPQLSLRSSLLWNETDPRFGVLSLPFLFDSEADAADALDGAGGQALAEILAGHGQHCIGIGSGGFRLPTNSLRPIARPADMAGLRLRVEDHAILQEVYALWGAQCVSLAWPLTYTALRTGTLDGQEMPPEDADVSSVQTVQAHATSGAGLYSGSIFCMEQSLYESLSPTLREIVDSCGRETILFQREKRAENTESVLARWQRAGVAVTQLTADDAAQFRAAAQPVYDRFAREISAELTAVFGG